MNAKEADDLAPGMFGSEMLCECRHKDHGITIAPLRANPAGHLSAFDASNGAYLFFRPAPFVPVIKSKHEAEQECASPTMRLHPTRRVSDGRRQRPVQRRASKTIDNSIVDQLLEEKFILKLFGKELETKGYP